jgi:hypothetical protein
VRDVSPQKSDVSAFKSAVAQIRDDTAQPLRDGPGTVCNSTGAMLSIQEAVHRAMLAVHALSQSRMK